MTKARKVVTLAVVLLFAFKGVGYMASSPKTPKIVETREFSCPGMTGFTFKYPVFEGCEVVKSEEINAKKNKCVIALEGHNDTGPNHIYVAKESQKRSTDSWRTNSHGLKYAIDGSNLTFYGGESFYRVTTPFELIKQNDLFFQTIIDSFRLISGDTRSHLTEQEVIQKAEQFILENGYDTLEPRAYGVSGGTERWLVAFRYAKREGSSKKETGRVVTMDPNGSHIQMQHQDFFLQAVQKKLQRKGL